MPVSAINGQTQFINDLRPADISIQPLYKCLPPTPGFTLSLQLPCKTHNHGHISIVASAANDRKGPKHTGTRIARP